ncbi:uncharacterized protein LOC114284072 [Camellia sinensis]|uniref:uncharacterized protein LOC114284072 n=1 Tax=Camellia sinensis TaxID=4442 RepID=UPI001035BA4B|nr:uncharacterized protein LOC114284072 [Camellia sinensis]
MIGLPDTRRRDQRCEYHKDHGHETNKCCALKDHLEELVQDGRLSEYLLKSSSSPNVVALRPDSPRLSIIHMIYSLLPPNRVNKIKPQQSIPSKPYTLAKRPRLSNEINFSNADLEGMTLLHDDVLVIKLRVNKFAIKRVLIDHGNTSEIMYYKTFFKLDLNDSDLLPVDYPLFNFNANPEYPLHYQCAQAPKHLMWNS